MLSEVLILHFRYREVYRNTSIFTFLDNCLLTNERSEIKISSVLLFC